MKKLHPHCFTYTPSPLFPLTASISWCMFGSLSKKTSLYNGLHLPSVGENIFLHMYCRYICMNFSYICIYNEKLRYLGEPTFSCWFGTQSLKKLAHTEANSMYVLFNKINKNWDWGKEEGGMHVSNFRQHVLLCVMQGSVSKG